MPPRKSVEANDITSRVVETLALASTRHPYAALILSTTAVYAFAFSSNTAILSPS